MKQGISKVALAIFLFVAFLTLFLPREKPSQAPLSPNPSPKEAAKGEEALARVLFIKLASQALEEETHRIVMTKVRQERLIQDADRLMSAIEEEQEAKWGEEMRLRIKEWLTRIDQNQERYEIILQKILKDELMEASMIAGLKTPEALFLKMHKENPSMMELFAERRLEIRSMESIERIEGRLDELMGQRCISLGDTQEARRGVAFLERNFQGEEREKILEALHQKTRNLEGLSSAHLASMDWSLDELKTLYASAIKNRCLELLERILTAKGSEAFIHERIEELEKPLGLRRYETFSYTPLEFAKRYSDEATLRRLERALLEGD